MPFLYHQIMQILNCTQHFIPLKSIFGNITDGLTIFYMELPQAQNYWELVANEIEYYWINIQIEIILNWNQQIFIHEESIQDCMIGARTNMWVSEIMTSIIPCSTQICHTTSKKSHSLLSRYGDIDPEENYFIIKNINLMKIPPNGWVWPWW